MSTTMHTPGPWQWDGDYTLRQVTPDPTLSAVHTILSPEGPYGFVQTAAADTLAEFEADKRLIAATPDLLNALELYVAHATEPTCAIARHVYSVILDAINKATGVAT